MNHPTSTTDQQRIPLCPFRYIDASAGLSPIRLHLEIGTLSPVLALVRLTATRNAFFRAPAVIKALAGRARGAIWEDRAWPAFAAVGLKGSSRLSVILVR